MDVRSTTVGVDEGKSSGVGDGNWTGRSAAVSSTLGIKCSHTPGCILTLIGTNPHKLCEARA